MRNLFTNDSLILPSGQAVSGIADRAQTMRILRGRVWITVEGISQDYFLQAGDTFTAIPGRLVVVEAEQDTGLDLPCPPTLRVLRNMRAWFAGFSERLMQDSTVQTSLKRHRACGDVCGDVCG